MSSAALSIDAPVAPGGPPPRKRRSLWDRLTIYLPVLLMGLLALASYWLLQATPVPPEARPERPITHEPDYKMQRFSVKVFDASGALKSEVFGDEARHHPDTDTTEIDQARIRSVGLKGQTTTATAQRVVTNGAQTELTLAGDAVVVREASTSAGGKPRMEFRGEFLQIFTQPERVVSDRPVVLVRGRDQLTADALDYQGDELRVAEFTGRVRATLAARAP
jgi:lipopolysaccharide export system protein LptC